MARKRYTPEAIIRKLREAEILQGQGKIIAQAVKRQAVQHVKATLGHSERRICRALGVARSTLRYVAQPR